MKIQDAKQTSLVHRMESLDKYCTDVLEDAVQDPTVSTQALHLKALQKQVQQKAKQTFGQSRFARVEQDELDELLRSLQEETNNLEQTINYPPTFKFRLVKGENKTSDGHSMPSKTPMFRQPPPSVYMSRIEECPQQEQEQQSTFNFSYLQVYYHELVIALIGFLTILFLYVYIL